MRAAVRFLIDQKRFVCFFVVNIPTRGINMASFKEFATFFEHLRMIIPRFAPTATSDDHIRLWFAPFERYSMDDYRKVFGYCRANFKEFPSCAELIETFETVVDKGAGTEFPFDRIIELAGTYGREGDWPVLPPPVAELVRRLGGQRVIGDWNVEYLEPQRKRAQAIWTEIMAEVRAGTFANPHRPALPSAHETREFIGEVMQTVANERGPNKGIKLVGSTDLLRRLKGA